MWINSNYDWYPDRSNNPPTITVLINEDDRYHEVSPILDQNGNEIKKPKRKPMGFIHIGSES